MAGGDEKPRAGWRRGWVPLVLVAGAGGLRLFRLGSPDRIYFDEKYYAEDAHQYLQRGVEQLRAVHPPVGKWMIAGGIEIFGFNPFGWRISAAVAGTLTVLFTYLAGRRLFAARRPAVIAAVLLAVDGLAFTMSRMAMLDGFVALFVSAGFYLVLGYRDARRAGGDGRGWLLATGVVLGLAVGTKLTALTAVGATVVFVLAVEGWGRGDHGDQRAPARRALAGLPVVLVALVMVPTLVYLASYSGWFAHADRTQTGRLLCAEGDCPRGVAGTAAAWLGEQGEILRFHRDLVPTHRYRSAGIGWPVLNRPVLYYFERCSPAEAEQGKACRVSVNHRAKVLGLGNPAVWWPALAAYPVLAWFAGRRRDWRAATLLLFLLALWLPLALTPRAGFFFYMTPMVGFMTLALAFAAEQARRVRWLRPLPVSIAVVAIAMFIFFYPVYAAVEGSRTELDQRIWTEAWR